MIQTIGVKELKFNCIIGIYPHERVKPQELIVDIEMEWDFHKAIESENVKDTIDYAQVAEDVKNLAIEKEYQLIETFSADAANLIMKKHNPLSICITIMKPAAIPDAKYPFVKYSLKR